MLLPLSLFWASSCAGADVEALYQSFLYPPRTNSLMPYWFWNGLITGAQTRRQIRQMTEHGIYQAVVFPRDGMGVQYLSEEYWQQVGLALESARKLGFTLNFADEYDWPSGHAWVVPSE